MTYYAETGINANHAKN